VSETQLDNFTRRSVLSGLGALIIGVSLPGSVAAKTGIAPDSTPALNAFVMIDRDGAITVLLPSSEMGQGVTTSLPQMVMEELDGDWSKLTTRTGPEAKDYRVSLGAGPMMVTGGSGSIMHWGEPMREAGAAARAMLVKAAAKRWGVAASECTTRDGVVRHSAGHEAEYGSLVDEAALLKPPRKPTLKPDSEHRLIGTSVPRTDLLSKVDGTAEFGIDISRPGQVWATTVACPVFGGTVGSVDDTDARAIPGVKDVLVFSDYVAVVAESWWPARKALTALKITWNEGDNADLDSDGIALRLLAGLDAEKPHIARREGKALDRIEESEDVLEAVYSVPYLDHAPIEPMNCTVHIQDDRCDVWVGTQVQTLVVKAVKRLTGLKSNQIHVHTTMLGGGFGRRGNIDFIEQALDIGMLIDGPVQVLWTREETFRHGFYRPAATIRMRATIAGDAPEAVHIRLASDNILHNYLPPLLHNIGLVADFPLEGFLHSSPYAFENIQVEWSHVDLPVPIGFWRSVGHSYSAYFMECFIDELAVKLGQDPVALRRSLMGDRHPRFRTLLDLAAQKAGWGNPPAGRFQGVAIHESFGSICAQVAEISMEDGKPRVHRVVAAVDCGRAINPGIVETQIMSGVIFGLSAAMGGKLTLANGRIQQSNYHDYPVLRMVQAPEVEVHIVDTPGAPIGGIGEIGTPPIAPAVCNAILAATGEPVRSLPIL
jgi:isoquinoline 1-oxidoreductase beta subunit